MKMGTEELISTSLPQGTFCPYALSSLTCLVSLFYPLTPSFPSLGSASSLFATTPIFLAASYVTFANSPGSLLKIFSLPSFDHSLVRFSLGVQTLSHYAVLCFSQPSSQRCSLSTQGASHTLLPYRKLQAIGAAIIRGEGRRSHFHDERLPRKIPYAMLMPLMCGTVLSPSVNIVRPARTYQRTVRRGPQLAGDVLT